MSNGSDKSHSPDILSGKTPYFSRLCDKFHLKCTEELYSILYSCKKGNVDLLFHYRDLGLELDNDNIGLFAKIELDDEKVFKLIEFQKKGVLFLNKDEIYDCLSCNNVSDEEVNKLVSKWESDSFGGFVKRHKIDNNRFKVLSSFIVELLKVEDFDIVGPECATIDYFCNRFSKVRNEITDKEFESILEMDEKSLQEMIKFFGSITVEEFKCFNKYGGLQSSFNKLSLFVELVGLDFGDENSPYRNFTELRNVVTDEEIKRILEMDEKSLQEMIKLFGSITIEEFNKYGGLQSSFNKLSLFIELLGKDLDDDSSPYINFDELGKELTDEEIKHILEMDIGFLQRFVDFSIGKNGESGKFPGFFGIVTLDDFKYIIKNFHPDYYKFKNLCLFCMLIGYSYENQDNFENYFQGLKNGIGESDYQDLLEINNTVNTDFFQQFVDLFGTLEIKPSYRVSLFKNLSSFPSGKLGDKVFDILKKKWENEVDLHCLINEVDYLYEGINSNVGDNQVRINDNKSIIVDLKNSIGSDSLSGEDLDDINIRINGLNGENDILCQELIDPKILLALKFMLSDMLKHNRNMYS